MYGLVDVASGDLRWVGDASSILDAVKAADQEAGDEAFDYMEMPAATASVRSRVAMCSQWTRHHRMRPPSAAMWP